MKLPRYWVRTIVDHNGDPTDSPDGFWAFGWSDVSNDDAQKRGLERARSIASRYKNDELLDDRYPYPDRPVREEVIERHEAQGWAITRNGYGSLVLNTSQVMFIDIDLSPKTKWGCLGRLLNLRQPQPVEPVIERTREVVDSIQGLGCRMYRTAAGLRLLVTSELQDPASSLTQDLLTAFGADKRYAMLCKLQESFRARLTPKPWRCGCGNPPASFPYDKPEALQKHSRWLESYNPIIGNFRVCELVQHLGHPEILPEISPIMDMHDRYCLGNTSKPLA